ncbi:hypothetical protein DXG01_006679 [Tephrocybe rancida]|nr:hypothetical protein DXG01_006679 [Tephrocybe rancida]
MHDIQMEATADSNQHMCSTCGESTRNRCSGCARAWFCSKRCQKELWPIHIFDCKTNKPIKTSYFLARAARAETLPIDSQTFEDYGFSRAVTMTERAHLTRLYRVLFCTLRANPKDVNNWLVNRTLLKEIKSTFDRSPVEAKGYYYQWILENQYILDDSLPLPADPVEHQEEALIEVWRFTGGSSKDTPDDISDALDSKLPSTTRSCHSLYCGLLIDPMYLPSPLFECWVDFGFCACHDEWGESQLGALYRQLIQRCTFKEISEAYETGQLIRLIDSRGLQSRRSGFPFLEGIVSQLPVKLVWRLKRLVEITAEQIEVMPALRPPRAILLDYGFVNCVDESETEDLKAVYKQVFDTRTNPLVLHEACMQGKLFDFVEKTVPSKKKLTRKQLRRLLKNPHSAPS